MVEEIEKIEIPSFQEIDGDLIELAFKGSFDIIAHGCNCHKLMGAGVAKQISYNFPEAQEVDYNDNRLYLSRLGDFTRAEYELDSEGNSVVIMNLYTQLRPGKNLDHTALRLSLRKMNYLYPNKTVGLPLIGCGIAGGNWIEVKEIIKKELSDMVVTIVHYKK